MSEPLSPANPLAPPMLHSEIPGLIPRRGKVRDVYPFNERLLFVATDRISAFDWVMPNGIPDKGRLLTSLSLFWFEFLGVPNHFLTMDLHTLPLPAWEDRPSLDGRSMVVRRTDVVPIECVVRGYLAGSGWKEYRETGHVCGVPLPPNLREGDKLPEPIFTPATKAETGHDENISFLRMGELVGPDLAEELCERSLDIYAKAAEYARTKGIIIADTKFEFGKIDDEIILIDEVLTPDSSRFWPIDGYRPGRPQPSFDKQFLRDWLETQPWDKNSPPPVVPDDIVAQTRAKYLEAHDRLSPTRG